MALSIDINDIIRHPIVIIVAIVTMIVAVVLLIILACVCAGSLSSSFGNLGGLH